MKILIVDDREENLYLLEALLKGNGYKVISAGNGIEALNKLKKDSIDLIISDILMPKMDGFQLCRECKSDEAFRKIPFVFYTATYIDKGDEEFARKLGAEKFIIKPVEPDVFINTIKGVIRDVEKGKILPKKKKPALKEKETFKLYSERLIKKLEKKMLDLEKSEKHIKYLYSVLGAIRKVNQLVVKEKNRDIFLQKTCDTLTKARGYNAVWLGLLKAEKTFAIVLCSPTEQAISRFCEEVMKGDCPPCIERAFTQKASFMVVDKEKDCKDCHFRFEHSSKQRVIMRIEHNDKLFGLLGIILGPDVYLDKEEKGLLKEVSDDVAFGLYDIELKEKSKLTKQKLQQSYQKLKKTMNDTINTIGKIGETRDPYTAGHQYRVSQLATAIAKELNLSSDKIEGIRITSLVHDIGKISIPAEILNKPIKLSEIEWSLIKDHSQTGHDILEVIDFPWPVAKIVLQHHERMNGSGYPNNLKGDTILLEARVLGVADVVEAMSSHRPYRPALGINKALEEIEKNKGILYDPKVVDVCIKLFKEKGFEFKKEEELH